MHRKMPAWFGGRPRGKGPAQQAPRRAAHPVESRVVPALARRPRSRGLGRGQGARGPGRRQRTGRRRDHRRSRRRRPGRRPADRRRRVRPLPDRQGRVPVLRPGAGRGLAHRHRGHRRSLPPPDRRPPRHHRSTLGTPGRRGHPHPARRHQQRRLRRLPALPPDPRAPAALPRHTTKPVTQRSLIPHSKRATPIGDRVACAAEKSARSVTILWLWALRTEWPSGA